MGRKNKGSKGKGKNGGNHNNHNSHNHSSYRQSEEGAGCFYDTVGEPTEEMMIKSSGPDMILYPEYPLDPGNLSNKLRGAVGHNKMFELTQIMLAQRVWKLWTKDDYDEYLFGAHTNTLLSVFDMNIAASLNPEPPQEREELMNARLVELERRVTKVQQPNDDSSSESFLFVPLNLYFLKVPHDLTKALMGKIGFPPNFVAAVMKGYEGAKMQIHLKGPPPAGGNCPPKEDMVGPIHFGTGLRMQSAITPILAMIHVNAILQCATKESKASSVDEVFIFPHGLVIAANKQRLGQITSNLHRVFPFWTSGEEWMSKEWRSSGPDRITMNGKQLKREDCSNFMDCVRREGCTLFPYFSDDNSD